jgi:hypothetical protein
MKKEYKPERANVPTKNTLHYLGVLYREIKQLRIGFANEIFKYLLHHCLEQERDDINNIKMLFLDMDYHNAMKRIAEILTCCGRIYDEFSEFLKPKEESE